MQSFAERVQRRARGDGRLSAAKQALNAVARTGQSVAFTDNTESTLFISEYSGLPSA